MLSWRDVTIGALGTAAMFTLGKYLIGLYIGNSGVASSFGAAGSMIALLLWVYYSAQIFFLGAEFARQYALQLGSLKHKPAEVTGAEAPPAPGSAEALAAVETKAAPEPGAAS
jgi:membrane protein